MTIPSQLRHPYLLAMLGALLVFFVWDFSSRVWLPVNTDAASAYTNEGWDTQAALQFEQYPEFLQRWMQQQNAAQEPTDEELERQRREQEEQERLQPLSGSTELDSIRLRVRAVFSRSQHAGTPLELALAEQQDIETGEVTRVVLRPGEEVGGYQIASIDSRVVTLTHNQRDAIELRVFTFE